MAIQSFSAYGMLQSPFVPAPEPFELKQEIVAEPVEAWRVWKIFQPVEVTLNADTIERLAAAHDEGRNPFRGLLCAQLSAIAQTKCWDKVTEASCVAAWSLPHDAPHSGCQCGLWALHKEKDTFQTVAEYSPAGGVFAFGRVKLWGRIIEHERGYRAQYASPASIVLLQDDKKLGDELAQRYGVTVSLAPDHGGVAAAMKRHREKIAAQIPGQLPYNAWAQPMIGAPNPNPYLPQAKPPPSKRWWKP